MKKAISLLLPIFLLINSLVYATSYTVTQTGNWSNVATWGGGGYPQAADNATLSGAYTLTVDVASACTNFTQSAGTVTQNAGLTVSGAFSQTAGTFTSTPADTFTVGGSFSIPAAGSGGIFTRYTGAGTSGSPYLITDVYGLQGMADNLSSYFNLSNNISAGITQTNSWNSSTGFVPVGNSTYNFTGIFKGEGFAVSSLYINLPSTNYVGLFGYSNTANISNVGLVGGTVTGNTYVGGLAGWGTHETISNSYAIGTVSGVANVGDLIGYSSTGTISNSYATGTVSGTSTDIGGLVGRADNGTISNSYATGTVSGSNNFIGGLVGQNGAAISNSFATGSVSGTGVSYVGGLVGVNNPGGIISSSYATGRVSGVGTDYMGGLVGWSLATISNSYAMGSVASSGNNYIGGLVGLNSGTITDTYSVGTVSGSNAGYNGGFVGTNSSGTYTADYWNSTINTGLTSSGAGAVTAVTGETTALMQSQTTFSGWNFSTIWIMPYLNTPIFLYKQKKGSGFFGINT